MAEWVVMLWSNRESRAVAISSTIAARAPLLRDGRGRLGRRSCYHGYNLIGTVLSVGAAPSPRLRLKHPDPASTGHQRRALATPLSPLTLAAAVPTHSPVRVGRPDQPQAQGAIKLSN